MKNNNYYQNDDNLDKENNLNEIFIKSNIIVDDESNYVYRYKNNLICAGIWIILICIGIGYYYLS